MLPVDASGEVTGSGDIGPFNGAVDLSTKLAESPQVQTCLATQWLRYALTRFATEDDGCSVEAVASVLRGGGTFAELVVAIATSDSFRYVQW